jgi:CBS domain containing-hemolysin-like protein
MILDISITLFLVFLNGFFVAAEFAIVKVRASQIELRALAGSSTAKLSSYILNNLDGYLAATQLGITLASLGLGWVGEPVVSKMIISIMHSLGLEINPDLAHHIALPIAFGIITVLHIVFGELAPKSFAIQRSETTTLLVAYPLNFFYLLFRPFIWILNGFANFILKMFGIHAVHGSEMHSADELKFLISQTSESGNNSTTDYNIVKNAFDFSERMAREIAIPINQVVALDIARFDDNYIEELLDEGYSRIPCYQDSIDKISGIIYVKDILAKIKRKEEIEIKKLIRPILFIPETKKIGALLKEFQRKHIHFAVMVNEFGATKGILTMEDIIEEIVGQIQDEYDDEAPIVERIDDFTYKVIASASINDINNLIPYPLNNEMKFDTLAGLIIDAFGSFPQPNEKVNVDNYEITVLERIKNSITLAQLRVNLDNKQ